MSSRLRVLIVEDSEDDALFLLRELRRGGYEPVFERVDTPEAMAAALDEQTWDVVIADYVMPRFSGPAALALIKERGLDLPFIVVSGKVDEEAAVRAMKAGAHDYITKKSLARLVPAIEREMRDAAVRRERHHLEEQLLRTQRLEMAGRIASQVAHDVANLLTPLVGYPQLIKRMLPADHPAIGLCDAMLTRVKQMAAINEDLLTLGRRGRLITEAVDLNDLVEQAVAQMPERSPTLVLQLDLTPNPLPVRGSAGQLIRVITNLLSNAREAMQDAGIIVARTRNVRVDEAFGRYNRIEAGEYVKLSISDSGSGIPPEIVDRVFDPFFTTKVADRRSGFGLGLSIVQAIVGDHGGYVDLETEQGRGTTFNIYLPVHQDALRGVVAEGPQGDVALSSSEERIEMMQHAQGGTP